MTDAENRKKFMQLLRMGVQHKVHNQQKNHGVSSEIVGRDRALVDEKMRSEARSASQSKRGLGVADLVGWQTLAWRNAFSMEPYFYETVKGKQLRIKQVLQGEVNGFGTGLTVWPAACVLLKLLEYQALSNLKALIESDDPFVLELGSGTGVVGIAAAMLLRAGRVVLTDMDNIRFIMQDNADLAQQDGVIDKKVVVDVNVLHSSEIVPDRTTSRSLNITQQASYPDPHLLRTSPLSEFSA
ncbi:Putative N2,N2-dimethylguanosine tRNA methyltransferase [Plasmopara halstedii]|uniref:Putative N2,N2-dimethylguanosine tRNA methyltransferase n=1 Tax=Plasmopara halstedii TaxID=4781 RepID=A0A0P1AY04_PLAHL|nr:Putative N2,N2-dimethylguanosine tRNA methyltransferase [Plasmopara halstedii]CEG46134.1 Putative N2,N2-dimethylguanosine tRNA methyltransferase [Plasmopara halstedii]|eukprot:XP_024582503.1 Putative N2,N2-dimethylguanosine tRNA methyltransferase [Plasmopara halstedii]